MARVLIVDDDELVRTSLATAISRLGHAVESYDDAQPAMSQANLGSIDLVITDLVMPTPGEVLVKRIREGGHDMPIMLISGYLGASRE